MDITMIGLQNAGKTSLLRVLAVSFFPGLFFICVSADGGCVDREGSLLLSK